MGKQQAQGTQHLRPLRLRLGLTAWLAASPHRAAFSSQASCRPGHPSSCTTPAGCLASGRRGRGLECTSLWGCHSPSAQMFSLTCVGEAAFSLWAGILPCRQGLPLTRCFQAHNQGFPECAAGCTHPCCPRDAPPLLPLFLGGHGVCCSEDTPWARLRPARLPAGKPGKPDRRSLVAWQLLPALRVLSACSGFFWPTRANLRLALFASNPHPF